MNDNHYCECCGRELNESRIVWLAHRISTMTYHSTNEDLPWFDTEDDQGAFPFGPGCAKRVLKNNGELR